MKTTRKRFKVRGTGPFPLDMLRYDAAWPASGEDAGLIEDSVRLYTLRDDERQSVREHIRSHGIELATDYIGAPTVGRWESFGWTVEEAGR